MRKFNIISILLIVLLTLGNFSYINAEELSVCNVDEVLVEESSIINSSADDTNVIINDVLSIEDEVHAIDDSAVVNEDASSIVMDVNVLEEDGADDEDTATLTIYRPINGSINIQPYNDDITDSEYTKEIKKGQPIVLRATPVDGARFVCWKNNLGEEISRENPLSFTFLENSGFSAEFFKPDTVTGAFYTQETFNLNDADAIFSARGVAFYFFEDGDEEHPGLGTGIALGTDTSVTGDGFKGNETCPWEEYRDKMYRFYADWIPGAKIDYAFQGFTHCDEFDFGPNFNTINTTSMTHLFDGCKTISMNERIKVSNLDVSNVANASYMFKDCTNLSSFVLPSFSSGSLTNCTGMFSGCTGITSSTYVRNFENINTSNVTNLSHMFEKCTKLNYLNLNFFDTNKCTTFVSMFDGCSTLKTLTFGSEFKTSNASSMDRMFNNCSSLQELNLEPFSIMKGCTVSDMLKGARGLNIIYTPHYMYDPSDPIELPKMADDTPITYYDTDKYNKYEESITLEDINLILVRNIATIKFNANSPSGTSSTIDFDEFIIGKGDKFKFGDNKYKKMPTPNCGELYTFAGWYTTAYAPDSITPETEPAPVLVTADSVVADSLFTDPKELTLYAYWEKNACINAFASYSSESSEPMGNVSFSKNSDYDINISKYVQKGELSSFYIYAKPTKEKYKFVKWSWIERIDDEDVEQYSYDPVLQIEAAYNDDKYNKYTAHFEDVAKHTITIINDELYGDYEIVVDSAKPEKTPDDIYLIPEGSKVSIAAIPNNEAITGYRYIGWKKNALPEPIIIDSLSVSIDDLRDDYTYETVYSRLLHVSYDANGGEGELLDTKDYLSGDRVIVKDNEFVYEDHEFLYWNTKADGTGIKYDPSSPDSNNFNIDDDTTLYAIWREITYYTVTFEPNGGTLDPSVVNPAKVLAGNTVDKPIDPVRSGYYFFGWYTSTRFTDAYKWDFNNPVNTNIKLYACWKLPYTISFIGNGSDNGSMSDQSIYFDVPTRLKNCLYKKAGYTFKSWNTKADGTGVSYYNMAAVTNLAHENENVKLYAQWNLSTYNIYYNLYGGVNDTGNIKSYNINDSFTFRDPSKHGYTFEGFYSDPEFNHQVSSIMPGTTGNIYLYAKWGLVGYPINYVLNGGKNNINNPSMYDGMSDILLKNPERDGYTFKGWYSDKFYVNRVNMIPKGSKGEKTLYAKWEGYSIKYVLHGGKNNKNNPKKYSGAVTITLKNPTRTGYTFEGWYLDPAYRTRIKQIIRGDSGKLTLYAKWSVHKYTIKFKGNGATGKMKNQTYKYGKKYYLPKNTFTKNGYKFVEWNTKKDGTGTSFKNKASIKNLTNKDGKTIVLYAIWKKKK